MPNYREVPRWKFGDILTNDEPSNLTRDHTQRAMFLAWKSLGDWDPSESIPYLVLLSGELLADAGTVITPYCGWWTDAEA